MGSAKWFAEKVGQAIIKVKSLDASWVPSRINFSKPLLNGLKRKVSDCDISWVSGIASLDQL